MLGSMEYMGKSPYLSHDFVVKLHLILKQKRNSLNLSELAALDAEGGWCGWRPMRREGWRGGEATSCAASGLGKEGLHLSIFG